VLDIHDMHVGLIVDKVSEVATVPFEKIVPPPKTMGDKAIFIALPYLSLITRWF
jgi:chemotaxis signal transduction protein